MKLSVSGAQLARLQVNVALMAPTAGVMHDHPAGAETDWNRMEEFGTTLKFTFVAVSGPPLVRVTLYVTFPSGKTGSGESVAATSRSICGASTVVVASFALFALFGSGVVPEGKKFATMSWSGKFARWAPTVALMVRTSVVPAANDGVLHVPLFPAQKHVHPAGTASVACVTDPGRLMFKPPLVAGSGPLLRIVTV